MEKKPSWNDIPSLGLQLDKDGSNQQKDNRAKVRLPCRDLLELFMLDTGTIAVQVKPGQGKPVRNGRLVDISQKGMGLEIAARDLKKNDSIVLGTVLGQRGFTTRAVVRWARPDKIGVEYINPKPEDYTFLSELYGAKVLNNI